MVGLTASCDDVEILFSGGRVGERKTKRRERKGLPCGSVVKNPLPMQMWVRSLGQEDPLE